MTPFSHPLFGLYIHWPYCLSKCPYCDFASTVCRQIDEAALLNGYKRDILIFKEKLNENPVVTSIFFGGGTPSLMSLSMCESVLNTIYNEFNVASDVEISLEANPDAIKLEKMKGFKSLGVNRLSIGVQSLNESDLRFLGRRHTLKRALTCIDEATHVFENINMDLIYARPNQTLAAWETELNKALSLKLPHYSLYQLTIEENTPFGRQKQSIPDEDTAVALYRLTESLMNAASISGYEVSNYARSGYECRHNLTYWRGYDYLGIGPAAQGRIHLWETINPRTVSAWLQSPPTCTLLTPAERAEERIIMGLRLKKEGFPCDKLDSEGVQRAISYGWATVKDNLFYPTEEGILLLNQLILLVVKSN